MIPIAMRDATAAQLEIWHELQKIYREAYEAQQKKSPEPKPGASL